jgi:hypothetical protein
MKQIEHHVETYLGDIIVYCIAIARNIIYIQRKILTYMSMILKLTEKRKDGRLFHLSASKENFQRFTIICRKPHVASSICLRATIFQNSKLTLCTHGMRLYVDIQIKEC